MRRLALVAATFLALAGWMAPGDAAALGCVDLGGTETLTECVVSSNVGNKSGTFDLDRTLRITASGRITVPHASGGNTLTLNACLAGGSCDVIMEPGAVISGDVSGSGPRVGATINISASNEIVLEGTGATGALITSKQTSGGCGNSMGGAVNLTASFDILIEGGAEINVDAKCSAGAVTIISTQGDVVVDGLISSVSQQPGTGGTQRPGGGPITVIARCNLSVSGQLVSQGLDPGADLIHLEGGCQVVISGTVTSTGFAHGVPTNPPNHCNNANRPDKPANSAACIEVWAGDLLLITSTAEINADTGGSGGNASTGWIDLFARGPITIVGPASPPFAVHANGNGGSGGDGEEGGIVTVKSTQGTVTASGRALQATTTKNDSNADGGQITVQAAGNVTLDTATLDAAGGPGGVGDTGGTIAVRSFQGALSWQNGVGDVRPNATGTIALEACGAITTTGTDFKGEVPSLTPASCAVTAPTLPSYVVLPDCLCGTLPGDGECPEDPHHLITRVVDPLGDPHGVLPVHLTLQAAVNSATSGETIGVFGTTEENVKILTKRLTITQCTVAKIKALDLTMPVIQISSPDQIIVIGLDTENGAIGWQLDSNGHELRGVRATNHGQFGIWVRGNKNRVTWNAIRQCGVGIQVDGASNDLRGGTVELNTGAGIVFGATATGNKVQGATVKQNGGDGITVEGTLNKVVSNKLEQNGGNGVAVSGAGNTIKGNTAGTGSGLGNGLDGFNVNAAGTILDSNKASANVLDGFDVRGGIDGSPNQLKGNQSNLGGSGLNRENGGPEYRLLGTIQNKGGNKADGVGVPKATKCSTFPKAGVTTLLSEVTCE